mgnify:CR=1 FL=1
MRHRSRSLAYNLQKQRKESPPAAPTGLQAVAGDGAVSLIWEPNSESDLAGYLVLRAVAPGETYDISINLVAPLVPGTYRGFWQMQNLAKQHFGKTVSVGITVPGAATPTPAPTQTPAPNINFTANPTSITAGQSVLFQWRVENVQAVFFFHEGQDWRNHGVAGVGQSTEFPPRTMDYYLRVVQRDNSVVVRTIRITVNPATNAPVINNFGVTPPQITLGQCVRVEWSVSGQVNRVALLINNAPVWDGAPISGSYQDCPAAAGTRIYTLQAFGPGGTTTQQVSVNVQNIPPTATPVPQQPTNTPVPPTATPVPTTPAPEPPVIQSFSVAPTNIEQGQCVIASWSTGGGTKTSTTAGFLGTLGIGLFTISRGTAPGGAGGIAGAFSTTTTGTWTLPLCTANTKPTISGVMVATMIRSRSVG